MLQLANDHNDLRAKLESIGYTGLRETDESLIQALVAVHLTIESFDLSKDAQKAVLSFLSEVGQASLDIPAEVKEAGWEDFNYGNVRFGDHVRVKKDAYDSDTGSRHNGLVGILTDMRGGICTVKYYGLATGNTMRHPMDKLESIKGVYNRRPS